MKLSFTTLACPDWDLDAILPAARKYGYDAIDFRHYKGSTALHAMPEFTTGLADTSRRIAAAGLKVSGLSSGIKVLQADPAKREQVVNDAAAYARIAAGLGAPILRVFGGELGAMPRPEAVRLGGATLRAMAGAAAPFGVTVALETHDDWTRGADAAALLDAAGAGTRTGVLWDVLNGWHNTDEQPEQTWKSIRGRVVATHWKDSSTSYPEKCRYCLPGQGRAPFREFHALLREGGYDGYYTFEWEKAWHPELAAAEISLPAFVQCMRALEKG